MNIDYSFGPWDIALIVGVVLQTTALTYAHSPRHKALIYALPIPFTLTSLSLGHLIDATNIAGLLMGFFYVQVVRLLYTRAKLPAPLAIGLGVAFYTFASLPLAKAIPTDNRTFWLAAVAVMALGAALLKVMPPRDEPGHRTPLPIWIKLPIIIFVVCWLLLIKKSLHGFMTFFPMVGVVGAYESRHSLWTMGRQLPIMMLTVTPLVATVHALQPLVGLPCALAAGWLVYALLSGLTATYGKALIYGTTTPVIEPV